MKWFRSNIKQGSRLALLALAIQFVLAFGHFHGVAARAATATTIQLSGQQAPSAPEPDQRAADPCAICAVMAMANAALFATPPTLPLPQMATFVFSTTGAKFLHSRSARVAFQPRAPPAS